MLEVRLQMRHFEQSLHNIQNRSANRKHYFILSFNATQDYKSQFVKVHHKVEICAMDMVNFFSNSFCKFSKIKEKISYTASIVHFLKAFAPLLATVQCRQK
jgi:predicted small integral membrane protein